MPLISSFFWQAACEDPFFLFAGTLLLGDTKPPSKHIGRRSKRIGGIFVLSEIRIYLNSLMRIRNFFDPGSEIRDGKIRIRDPG